MAQSQTESGTWRRLHLSYIFHSKWLLFPPTAYLGSIVLIINTVPNFEVRLVPQIIIFLIQNIICYLPIFAYLLFRHFSFRFQFHDDRLVVRKGLIEVSDSVVQYEMLHGLDTTRSLLHRLFGTVKVGLQTRSTIFTGIDLRSVRLAVADELRENLESYQKHRANPIVSTMELEEPSSTDTSEVIVLHSMSILECCKLGLVRSRAALVVSAIATFLVARFSQIGSMLGESMDLRLAMGPIDMRIIGGLIPWMEVSILEGVDIWELSIFLIVISCVFLAILLAMSLLLAIAQFYKFQLTFDNTILRGESGLLIRAIQNTPLHRVQAVRILSTVRSRLLNRESIWFGTSAMPAMPAEPAIRSDQNLLSLLSHWLVPLVPTHKTREITRRVLPNIDIEQEEWETVDVSRVWKRRFNLHLTYLLILTAIFTVVNLWLLAASALLVGWAILVSMLYAKSLHYQLLDDAIMYRKGWWSRTWTIVPFDKIQAVRLTQNLFDRRFNMATLNIDVAAYGTLNFPKHLLRIPYLHAERCREMLEILILEASHRENEW
ncbi:MAG: PH domain-containing protein [Gammaproteobacteria bacterium]|nr:PH domain-containing protein [Gammaproteobacteria bacterium]